MRKYSEEIEELKKVIEKIKRKRYFSWLGIAFGIFLMGIALEYYINNPSVIGGSISLAFIGAFTSMLNIISLIKRNKRIKELSVDLGKLEELNK